MSEVHSGRPPIPGVAGPARAAINDIFQKAHREGRSSLFEHEVYRLLAAAGIASTPRHEVIAVGARADGRTSGVVPGKPGGREDRLRQHCPQIGRRRGRRRGQRADSGASRLRKHACHCAGHCGGDAHRVHRSGRGGVGSELLVGIRNTREFGMIISAGIGGVDTELLAASARRGQAVVSASTALTSAEEFLELFKPTIGYRRIAGLARGGRRLVTDEALVQCFGGFIRLANSLSAGNPETDFVIEELEVNPFTCSAGSLVALDGLCRIGRPQSVRPPRPQAKIDRLLHPASIGIIGASATRMNFGRIVLKNIIASGYDKSRLLVINPDGQEVDGVRCATSLGALEKKLDLLILAVTADVAFKIIDEVIKTDAVESVLLIPGGMGETEASREPARRMLETIDNARREGRGPVFVGGNCLGIISHPGNYDSWFIPEERLPRTQKKAQRSSALISQSGAFLVTRLSKNAFLDPAYMVAVGNQNDITHGDMIENFAANPPVHVIGAYVEGFKDLDGLAVARAVRKATLAGKQVVIYKAGQSAAGKQAAMGHTASIAGDYEVCLSVLTQAGALVATDVSEFSDLYLHLGLPARQGRPRQAARRHFRGGVRHGGHRRQHPGGRLLHVAGRDQSIDPGSVRNDPGGQEARCAHGSQEPVRHQPGGGRRGSPALRRGHGRRTGRRLRPRRARPDLARGQVTQGERAGWLRHRQPGEHRPDAAEAGRVVSETHRRRH